MVAGRGDTGGLEDGTTDQDQLLRAVEALGRRNGEPVYVLRIEENKTSWGADGGALNVILDTVQDVMSEATWAALIAIGSMIAGKVRDRLGHRDITEEEAVEAARQRLQDRQALDPSNLTIAGVSLQPGEAQVTFHCPPRSRRYSHHHAGHPLDEALSDRLGVLQSDGPRDGLTAAGLGREDRPYDRASADGRSQGRLRRW